ncbi:MAG TPA: NYN domain-containing protein [Aggregatilineales bacterium]|nr:NYN domain-containing protein [Aggregatilineales bacterium]
MLLVDGHNLIGQLQDLSLDDPFDEAKLSMAVRTYCMRSRSKATIIFDNGLPGGVSKQLSNSSVTVIFAPAGTQADTLLMRRARDHARAKEPLLLVTSDRRILRLAFAYGIETLSSPEFAIMIGFRPVDIDPEGAKAAKARQPRSAQAVKIAYDKEPNPVVSPQEVAYWLPIFERRLQIAHVKRAASRKPRRKLD